MVLGARLVTCNASTICETLSGWSRTDLSCPVLPSRAAFPEHKMRRACHRQLEHRAQVGELETFNHLDRAGL